MCFYYLYLFISPYKGRGDQLNNLDKLIDKLENFYEKNIKPTFKIENDKAILNP